MAYDVLMFGWEYPPYNSGGLGVACKGLAKALARAGNDITFVLPERIPVSADEPGLSFCFPQRSRYPDGNSNTVANSYNSDQMSNAANEAFEPSQPQSLLEAVYQYGAAAKYIARDHKFDVIHVHDWLTYPAGIIAQEESGKPLVAHIHATEYDRTGGHDLDDSVFTIEKTGFSQADQIIAVSKFTKDILTDKYGINEEKIIPAHNGIDRETPEDLQPILSDWKQRGNKIILFLGRQTMQKGPDYFLRAANKLLAVRDDVMFVMAGSGDMQERLIAMAADMGIGDRVLFPGFVRGKKVDRLYQSADLYVLSSISEPFGITPLEALMNKTPVLISNQSGVSEVVNHALTVDFWNIDSMAHKMDAALRYPVMSRVLRNNGHQEVKNISWKDTAEKCINCYQSVTD